MNDIEMAAESLFQSLVCWSPVLMILAGATVIVAVATARRTPKPGTEPSAPRGTGGRGTTIAVLGHVLGVITLLCALAGLFPAFGMFEGDDVGQRVERVAFIALVISGFGLSPALFAIGIVIARGGGAKSRAAVLVVAVWVAVHHVVAAAAVTAMGAPDFVPQLAIFGVVVALVGFVHACAMAWVALARIGTAAA